MRAILLRHGKTEGNLRGCYIGSRTDEPLCEAGRAALKRPAIASVTRVYCSPMLRCRETAALLYPELEAEIIDDLRECDFGAFEGLNYEQLNGRADYQAWVDSGGTLPFPGGESRESMTQRVLAAYERIRNEAGQETCAFIVHGGTIMAVMAAYASPHRDYFDWQIGNGQGFVLEEDGSWERV